MLTIKDPHYKKMLEEYEKTINEFKLLVDIHQQKTASTPLNLHSSSKVTTPLIDTDKPKTPTSRKRI